MLQFYEVVPVPTLLEVLAADAPAVAQRVQRLVLPFYFSGAHSDATSWTICSKSVAIQVRCVVSDLGTGAGHALSCWRPS